MSLPCFYVPPAKWQAKIDLDAREAAHAHVLRLQAGDEIQLLDGRGRSALGRLDEVGRQSASAIIIREESVPEPAAKCVVALALSKAARRGFFMEKASELGAWEICLWQADNSQGKLGHNIEEGCRSQLIAGLKQSRNPWLPGLRCLPDAPAVAEWCGDAQWRLLPWERHAGVRMLQPEQLGRPGKTALIIGPEGGFSERELAIFNRAGFEPVSLGDRVLRCETAAMLCLGLHWWAAQLPERPNFSPGASL